MNGQPFFKHESLSAIVLPNCIHPGRAQMFVVEGRIDVDGTVLEAGDYAFTEPGEWHEVRALAGCVVLLSFGQRVTVLESSR